MVLTVSSRRASPEVNVSLVQSYAGEEHVDTSLMIIRSDSSVDRTEVIGSETARTVSRCAKLSTAELKRSADS